MNWNSIRKAALFFLIALSLFLSWNIWTAGSRVGESTSSTSSGNPGVIFDRSLTNVFGPVQVAVHEQGSSRITSSEGMLSELNDSIVNWTIEELNDPVFLSSSEFLSRVEQQPSIMLIFEGMTPFALFEEMFDDLPSDYEQRTFNRILLPIQNPSRLTFYNMDSNLAYEAEVSGISEEIINTLAYNGEQEYYPAGLYSFGDRLIYLPVNSVEVPYVDYLIERLPNSLFVDRFFDDTSEVDVRRNESVTRYIDLVSEMRINETTNILTYNRQRSSNNPLAFSENARNTYRELLRVENWTQETHYHNYDRENNITTYRRYIDGLPVFGPNGEGAIDISMVTSGLSFLRVPLNVVQTPIAPVEDSYTKTIQSGVQVRTSLEGAGVDFGTIEDIKIGLTWTMSDESSRVVHFEPEWYVLIDGNWQRLQQLVNSEGGM